MNSFAYKKSIRTISLILFLSVILSVFSGCTQEEYSSETDESIMNEKNESIISTALEKIQTAIDAQALEKIVFTDEEKACAEEIGYYPLYTLPEARRMVANKLSEFYNNRDFDGLIAFSDFLALNGMDSTVGFGVKVSICPTDEFLSFLKEETEAKGEFLEENTACTFYLYNGREIAIHKGNDFVGIDSQYSPYDDDGTCVMYYGYSYMYSYFNKSKDPMVDYFTVGETVEFADLPDEVEEEESENYYPAATCSRCGTQWRANTTRAICIKKYGYCKAPWCERMAS
jgi:hypothetical protein